MRFTIDPNVTESGLARASKIRVRFPAVLPVCAPPHPGPATRPWDAVTDLQAQQIGTARLTRLKDGAATYRTARRWWRRPTFSMDARRIDGQLRAVAIIALPANHDAFAGRPANIGPRPLR